MAEKKVINNNVGRFPGTKLKGTDRYKKLYHYTSACIFKKIWESQSLRFGCIDGVNDILEAKKKWSSNLNLDPNKRKDFLDTLASYKQISLTKDYDSYKKGCMSPPMWEHYGKKSKGVCLELDFSKLPIDSNITWGEIKYVNYVKGSISIPYNLADKSESNDWLLKNIKDIFFNKLIDWKGENEFRLISRDLEFLDISDAISAIYVADHTTQECRDIEELVKGRFEVKEFYYFDSEYLGTVIPMLRSSKNTREDYEKARNNTNNALNQYR